MTFLILADVVWPALFLSIRMAAWWCVLVSLLVEGVALWRFASLPPAKALVASVVMNSLSALCGTLLLPLLGIRLEAIATTTYNEWLGWGTFNPITILTTFIGAVLVTTAIECLVLWLAFAMPWNRRWVAVVLGANTVTVALAGVSVLLYQPQ
jgi:hypothetical protein